MSKIEWTEETWNPVVGCTRASKGCDNCYAVAMSHRLEAMGGATGERYAGLTVLNGRGDRHFNGTVRTVPEVLEKPLGWRKPRVVFVNSMSDLFHPSVPFEFIDRVFAVMALTPRHTYQILTKRPERMAEYLERTAATWVYDDAFVTLHQPGSNGRVNVPWPLPNVWLGTSCEDQPAADERIGHLLRCPAAVRFLSCEPLVGPVRLDPAWNHGDFDPEFDVQVDWVIVGGESGGGARPCNVAWIRSIVNQCSAAGVPCFVKQLGAVVWDRNDAGFDGDPHDAWDYAKIVDVEHHPDGDATVYQGAPVRVRLHDPKGGNPAEWPEDLRVREFPATVIDEAGGPLSPQAWDAVKTHAREPRKA